jgi:hypothetical protein
MINSVRNTVLSVLNKNNYGYISPSDFNLFAKQAQLEVYEEYFSNYNKTVNAENLRTSGSDYADINKAISETIESFLVNDLLTPNYVNNIEVVNGFYIPSLITTGNEAYMINKVLCNRKIIQSEGDNISSTGELLFDNDVDFIALGVSLLDIVTNLDETSSSVVIDIIDEHTLLLNDPIFANSQTVPYAIFSKSNASQVEKVSDGKISLLNNSLLTAPSLTYPAYSLFADRINVYPSSINTYGQISAVYFRYPKEPKWTYITINGSAVFDQTQSDYQDFEMPQEDEFKLVMKILQYAGVSIRELPVTQFAIAQEQHEQPTFSQQQ